MTTATAEHVAQAEADALADMQAEDKEVFPTRTHGRRVTLAPQVRKRKWTTNPRGIEDETVLIFERWLGWLCGPHTDLALHVRTDRTKLAQAVKDKSREYLAELELIDRAINAWADHRDRTSDGYQPVAELLRMRVQAYREVIEAGELWPVVPALPTVRVYRGFNSKAQLHL